MTPPDHPVLFLGDVHMTTAQSSSMLMPSYACDPNAPWCSKRAASGATREVACPCT
jgi:hypothetical protein